VDGRYLNDLLPMPYTPESLAHFVRRVDEAQEYLGRELLIENPSSYLAFQASTIPEAEFLVEVARRSGCGILLDINNIYVSSRNHGFDPEHYLAAIPPALVREIHLAGYSVNRYPEGESANAPSLARGPRLDPIGEILIDTHIAPVYDAVWTLYRRALEHLGPLPTLIEWDTDLPALPVLVNEADKARQILETARRTPVRQAAGAGARS
jgi:uncharacterized protein (UPF0276 family)